MSMPEAVAQDRNMPISRKYSVEIGRAIKGMDVEKAKNYLKRVMKFEDYIPVKKYTGNAGHRKGKNRFKIGKYPLKAVKEFLRLIKSAEENAKYMGLGENLYIKNVEVTKGITIRTPKKRKFGNRKSTNVRIVLSDEK